MMFRRDLRMERGMVEMARESIVMDPDRRSRSRKRVKRRDDFPLENEVGL
jgi:hypothetical protein